VGFVTIGHHWSGNLTSGIKNSHYTGVRLSISAIRQSALADANDDTDVKIVRKNKYSTIIAHRIVARSFLTKAIKIPDDGTITCRAYVCMLRREGFEIS